MDIYENYGVDWDPEVNYVLKGEFEVNYRKFVIKHDPDYDTSSSIWRPHYVARTWIWDVSEKDEPYVAINTERSNKSFYKKYIEGRENKFMEFFDWYKMYFSDDAIEEKWVESFFDGTFAYKDHYRYRFENDVWVMAGLY